MGVREIHDGDFEAQNAMFEAIDYFPAYMPAWDEAPELYTDPDPYFGDQDPSPNSIATEIAGNVPVVNNTIMGRNGRRLYLQLLQRRSGRGGNSGADPGAPGQRYRDCLRRAERAQIQTLKDAGVWEE